VIGGSREIKGATFPAESPVYWSCEQDKLVLANSATVDQKSELLRSARARFAFPFPPDIDYLLFTPRGVTGGVKRPPELLLSMSDLEFNRPYRRAKLTRQFAGAALELQCGSGSQ
jgi:hypothetical protein